MQIFAIFPRVKSFCPTLYFWGQTTLPWVSPVPITDKPSVACLLRLYLFLSSHVNSKVACPYSPNCVINGDILQAVKSTNAWILTGGMNLGVMKSVGEAVNQGQYMVKVSTNIPLKRIYLVKLALMTPETIITEMWNVIVNRLPTDLPSSVMQTVHPNEVSERC